MTKDISSKIFNYNSVDKYTAEFLKAKENNMREIVGKAYTDLGRELKEAQDRLAGSNQYDGLFEDWFTALGFKKQTVYNLIQRYNLLIQNLDKQEVLEELPVSLTYEISKPSADQELKQKVLNGEIKTLKQLKQEAEKKAQEAESKARQAQEEKELLEKKYQQSQKYVQEVEEKYRKKLSEPPKVEVREVVKQVVPNDYQDLLNKLKEYERTDKYWRSEYQKKTEEMQSIKNELQQLKQQDTQEQYDKKLKDSALMFCTKINKFIQDVGGLAWVSDYINDLPQFEKQSYVKAINMVEGWATTIKLNMNKGD